IAEGGDPNRDDCCFYASPEVLAQPIVENPDLFNLRRHHCSLLRGGRWWVGSESRARKRKRPALAGLCGTGRSWFTPRLGRSRRAQIGHGWSVALCRSRATAV